MAKDAQHLCLRAMLGVSASTLLDRQVAPFPLGPHGKALHMAPSRFHQLLGNCVVFQSGEHGVCWVWWEPFCSSESSGSPNGL